jgi:hypothetical protein
MRLLNVKIQGALEPKEFIDLPSCAVPSHTWDKEEFTFQDV